jgi:multidrug efflux pump subunit AcrA (membrane-fusion protein)
MGGVIFSRGNRRKMKGICALGVAGLVLALVAGCGSPGADSAAASQATPTPLPTPIVPETPTYTVQTGTVVQTLEFTGRASPVQQQELSFETSGNVGDVYVSRGDWVESGDVLAELDVADLEKQLSQQQLNLETTQLKFDQAQIDATKAITTAQSNLSDAEDALKTAKKTANSDITAAQASVKSAQTSLDNAKLNLSIVQNSDTVAKNVRDRQNEANWYEVNYGEYLEKFNEGQIDQDRLTLEYNNLLTAKEKLATAQTQAELALSQAESQVSQAEESLRQAKEKLAELQEKPAVADAEKALEQAQTAYDDAVAAADPDSYNMRLQALDLEQAQLNIQDLQDQIASAQLVAPFDGQVLSLNVQTGDSVQAYSAVGVLADPNALEITAELSSDELSQMAVGQDAVITLRNRPGETYNGSVRQLPYPYGGTTVDSGDDDTAVHVSIEGAADMNLGELATVSIVLQEKENVLWLPPAAIRTYQGRNFVVVQNPDGTQQRVDIQLGIETDERVEIVAGLEEGQVIVGE